MLLSLLLLPLALADSDSESPFPTINLQLDRDFYNIIAAVGSQSQTLRLDIVNPFIWTVDAATYPVCSDSEDNQRCATYDNYEQSGDATALANFEYEAIDGLSFNATVVKDSFSISDFSINGNVGFADDFTSFDLFNNNISFSSMNIMNVNQTSWNLVGGFGLGPLKKSDYPNTSWLNEFFDLQFIGNRGYSLWLDPENGRGEIILGGVDSSKYVGQMVQFQGIPSVLGGSTQLGYPIFPLTMASVTASNGNSLNISASGDIEPVLLDSRYKYTYLPFGLVINLAVQLNAFYVQSLDKWLVSCSVGNLGATMNYAFGNITINVPISDMLFPAVDSVTNSSITFSNGSPACYLGVYPNLFTGYSILGISFVKNVYLAVDQDGGAMGLAQAAKMPASRNSFTQTAPGPNLVVTSVRRDLSLATDSIVNDTLSQSNTDDFSTATKLTGNFTDITVTASTAVIPATYANINSGIIPFALPNNISTSLTLSSVDYNVTSSIPFTERFGQGEQTAQITNGEIFTGAKTLFTTTSWNTTPSAAAVNLKTGFMGIVWWLGLLLL